MWRASTLAMTVVLSGCFWDAPQPECDPDVEACDAEVPGGTDAPDTDGPTAGDPGGDAPDAPDTPAPVPMDPAPEPPRPAADLGTPDAKAASRFLTQASFGANADDIAEVVDLGYEDWITAQMGLPMRSATDRFDSIGFVGQNEIMDLFWENAIEGEDQLRQRVAYALSQVFVVSARDAFFFNNARAYTAYLDILQEESFGNYGDLVERITLNPAMGFYLSHLGNKAADPEMGTEPDENYAREVMQLFTIGLEELFPDGTPKGVETYTIDDVKGLAAVLTGLSWADTGFENPFLTLENVRKPMAGFPAYHQQGQKTFLGNVVTGSEPVAAAERATDQLMAHPNVAPFVSKLLIQRLVTSNPSRAYVASVARAFEDGRYALPSGRTVGDGRKGDMSATIAAILLDPEARSPEAAASPVFGKVREPVLRFAHWARAFRDDLDSARAEGAFSTVGQLRFAENTDVLAQKPYFPPSVFNFYRPGYVASGTQSAASGLVAPELQIASSATMPGYINFMFTAVQGGIFNDFFKPDYTDEMALADDPAALVDRLDAMLTYGEMAAGTRRRITDAVALIDLPVGNEDRRRDRVELAVLMVVTSPEYMAQR